jgi:hypothetical protein
MYIGRMKAKKRKYPSAKSSVSELKENPALLEPQGSTMVRTQIYLSKAEHDFLQSESRRRDEPMASIIRSFIDEKMEIPEEAWTNNPMLEPTVSDPDAEGHEDSSINHDHYIYGCPKKWIKVKGEWIESPPLPDDYYQNRASADAYDKKLRELDESR